MDLADPEIRADLTERLMARYADRPAIVGPGILAARTEFVAWVREAGGTALVLSTAHGAGPTPSERDCVVVDVEPPPTASVTEELRALDHLARHLPDHAVAAIEAFDPERRGVWVGGPFVTTDEPILGRPVVSGRPAAFVALEDKMLADRIWDAAGVARAPYEIVPTDRDALAAATARLAGPLGAVWSGDTREGFNGGGDYVRWVRDDADRAEGAGLLPAALRPRARDAVPRRRALLDPRARAARRDGRLPACRDRDPARRGRAEPSRTAACRRSGTRPQADREEMRAAARRVGEHLRATYGYRGAFGIDGVLTADGFRPTELNARGSAGFTQVTDLDRKLFTLLQDALVLGEDPGVRVADVEALLPLIEAERSGRPVALAKDAIAGDVTEALTWDGERFEIAPPGRESDDVLVMAGTPSGLFAKVQPCAALGPGVRLSKVNLALYDLLRREFDLDLGDLSAAPDLR